MEKKYTINIDSEIGLVVAKFEGKIEINNMLEFLTELYSFDPPTPDYPIIYDFKDCIALGYRFEVLSFVQKLSLLRRGKKNKKKVGVLISGVNQKFLVKALIGLIKGLNLEIEMFEDRDICFNWVLAKD
jgi:hypothetical protein